MICSCGECTVYLDYIVASMSLTALSVYGLAPFVQVQLLQIDKHLGLCIRDDYWVIVENICTFRGCSEASITHCVICTYVLLCTQQTGFLMRVPISYNKLSLILLFSNSTLQQYILYTPFLVSENDINQRSVINYYVCRTHFLWYVYYCLLSGGLVLPVTIATSVPLYLTLQEIPVICACSDHCSKKLKEFSVPSSFYSQHSHVRTYSCTQTITLESCIGWLHTASAYTILGIIC